MAINQGPFTTGGPYTAADATSIVVETNNDITASGQTPSAGTTDQMAISNAVAGAKGDFYQEAGGSAADVYVLENSDTQRQVHQLKDGMRIRFRVTNTNTGASTVNINALGAKNIEFNDSALTVGLLLTGEVVKLIFDESNNKFDLDQTPSLELSKGYISGFITENAADIDHDITVNIGTSRAATNDNDISLASAITKQIDANWTEGTNLGGFPSALTLSADTWYHVFVISKPDGTTDAGFDTALNPTNLLGDATGYTFYRRVGSVLTNGSSNIIQYEQTSDHFRWLNPINDLASLGPLGTTLTNITVSTPSNLDVIGQFVCILEDPNPTEADFFGKNAVDHSVTVRNNIVRVGGGGTVAQNYFEEIVGNSILRYKAAGSTVAVLAFDVITRGYIDFRGKDS